MKHRASTRKARHGSSLVSSKSGDRAAVPSAYKHVAHGLIFLKHISDSFEAKYAERLADYPEGAEDPDEYAAENMFRVSKEARWLPCSTS
jgi:type I restriction-modification system DNA methylase subunit